MSNVKIKLNKNLSNTNIYSDIDINSDYSTKTLHNLNAIRNSISNLLSWKPGERLLYPSLGNSLWKRVFDNLSNASVENIRAEVQNILSYETRISIESIDVYIDVENYEINVMFSYSVPELSNIKNGTVRDTFSITISNS